MTHTTTLASAGTNYTPIGILLAILVPICANREELRWSDRGSAKDGPQTPIISATRPSHSVNTPNGGNASYRRTST